MSILSNLSEEEKEQLKDYVNAIKETKRAIKELVSKAKGKAQMEDKNWGGPRKDMVMPVEQAGKRNVQTITLHIDTDEDAVVLQKLLKNTPALQRLVSPEEIIKLKKGDNIVNVNHTSLGTLRRMQYTLPYIIK